MNGIRCVVSTVQFLTLLSTTFIVFVYLTLPNERTSGTTIIQVTVSDRAPVLPALPNDTMMISYGKNADDNDDYNDTSKGEVATYIASYLCM